MEQYGLIGYPLHHSFSKGYFNKKFEVEKIDATYDNYEIESIGDVMKIISDHPHLCGLNVTIPYKEQIISFLDEIDGHARTIGAVNVIKIGKKNKKKYLTGYNSDYIGFKESIQPYLPSYHKKALILGTGGSAKAISYGLKQLSISSVFVSRKKSEGLLTYDELNEDILHTHTVIVNCTPTGMFPQVNDCPQLPYHLLTSQHILYDLIYNPKETLFLKKGKEKEATVVNGLDMLLRQAEVAWKIWKDK